MFIFYCQAFWRCSKCHHNVRVKDWIKSSTKVCIAREPASLDAKYKEFRDAQQYLLILFLKYFFEMSEYAILRPIFGLDAVIEQRCDVRGIKDM